MSKTNDGGAAFPNSGFPTVTHFDSNGEPRGTLEASAGKDEDAPEYGMSLRDWFAGQALPALVTRLALGADGKLYGLVVAECAYAVADAMLAERQKGGAA